MYDNYTLVTLQTALSMAEEREKSYDALVAAKKEEINEMKCVEPIKDSTIKGTEEMYRQSKVNVSNDAIVLKTNNRASSRELVPIVPIMRSTHNAQPSQETLHEVRRKLQNLHNVLQTYQDTSRSPEIQESTDRIGEVDSFITIGFNVEEAGRNGTDYNANMNENLQQYSSEYFELNCSEESLSSLAEYSSHTSKTYQCSSENITLRNTHSKGFSRHNMRRSVRSNLPAFMTIEPRLPSRSAILRTTEDYENEYKESACKQNISDRSNYELKSSPKANRDATKTDTLNIQDNISEAISKRILYILSPENKDIQTQNEMSSMKRFATEKFNTFDKENVTTSQNSSQNKMSNNSKEDKSTALLLQEALHFKNALLTQSRKKYLISNIKQDDIADESPPVSNNFPSMIIDIKEEEPTINNSRDKINQRYICLEMKQRRDLFSQSSKKVNTFAHREDKRDTESQDHIHETSSEYFSITDFAIHNSAENENNVPLKPPIYEKVISITIPVNVKNQDEINMNERPMQTETVLRNIQTHVNLKENAASDIDDNLTDKRSPTMLKLEDLILERVKNIRDYMDTFLQSQNTAIFKARRALQCQNGSDIFRCSDEASHVVVYNRLTAPSSCNSTDQIVGSSKKSSDFLTNTWPNYTQEYKQEADDVLKCCSNMYLKRNPGMFALITPTKNKFSIKNDTQQSEVATELERREADLSLPITLIHSCKNDSNSTHKITDSIRPRCEELISNTENGKIDKSPIIDINADFHKCRKQTQITESKPSTISYFPIDVANADAKVIHIAREECLTKSNCSSISHSNSYFTDEEIISNVKLDNTSSKSTSNMEHSHVKSNVQKGIKQNVIKQQISVDECPDANITMPSKLSSDNEYSNLTVFIDSNYILDESRHDLANAKTVSPLMILKENDFIFDPNASLLPFSLDKENKALKRDSISLNNLKQNNKISIDTTYLSPRIEHYSTKPFQIKAKSDMSLITNRSKNLKVNLYPKKSHSSLIRRNTMEYVSGILHQPYAKLHNDKNKYIKNKLRLASQSKSIISARKVSTKSCIPILKNRLESSHRMKHQAQARSPMRSPLTMLWGEKTYTKNQDKEVARSDNISMNKHFRVETVSNLTAELNTEKDILNKELEKPNVTCRDSNTSKNSGILSNDQNVESLAIDKKHSDKRDICGSKSDTSIIQHIKKIASKEVVVISIMANDSLRKKYPADLFILNTKNVSPTTDLLIHKNKLWTITVEKTEKEVTAKPSITDTCTSMSDVQ